MYTGVMQVLFVLTGVGFVLSVYGLFVERKSVRHNLYKPLCDIGDHASCTRAFRSKAGHLISGVPNTFLGIIFYAFIAAALWKGAFTLVVYGSICATALSLYLASVLVRQRNFCVVCFAVYVINIVMLYSAVLL